MLATEQGATIKVRPVTLRSLPSASDVTFPELYGWSPISTTTLTNTLRLDKGLWGTWRNRGLTPDALPEAWFCRASGRPLCYRVDQILTWLAGRHGDQLDTLETWQHSLGTLFTRAISDPTEIRKQARHWATIAGPRVRDVRFTPTGFAAYLDSLSSV